MELQKRIQTGVEPLFLGDITEMSHAEKEAELKECRRALMINCWQTSSQAEEVVERIQALQQALEPPPTPFQKAMLNGSGEFSLLR